MISAVVLTAIAFRAMAQTDKNVKVKKVPSQVKAFVTNHFPDAKKIRFYIELENDSIFYQANFISKKDAYSILMYPDGREYEREIVIKFGEMPPQVQEKIREDLKKRYDSYAVRLVEQVDPHGVLKYEIKVRARKNGHHGFFEVFYDSHGTFLEVDEETLKSIPSNSGF
jgi:hypothetical protein